MHIPFWMLPIFTWKQGDVLSRKWGEQGEPCWRLEKRRKLVIICQRAGKCLGRKVQPDCQAASQASCAQLNGYLKCIDGASNWVMDEFGQENRSKHKRNKELRVYPWEWLWWLIPEWKPGKENRSPEEVWGQGKSGRSKGSDPGVKNYWSWGSLEMREVLESEAFL